MTHWIMKSEPGAYSIDDLRRDRTTSWDGVRNYQVRNMMRDDMKKGDTAFFYHSGVGEPGVVGVMKIVKEAYPDPTQFDKNDSHYDPKSKKDNPRWLCVDVRFVKKFRNTILLEQLKKDKVFASSRIVERGNRLSVVPITKKMSERVFALTE